MGARHQKPRRHLPETTEKLPYRDLVVFCECITSRDATRNLAKYLVCFDHITMYKLTVCCAIYKQLRITAALVTYSDADYTNDSVDRRSISCYITMLDGNVISYASSKQEINAMSTCEGEYVAMSEAAKDILWLQGLCKELAWQHPVPLMLGDNEGAISLSTKPGKHSKTKHIENKYHMVRRNVELERMTVEHCGTEDMVADIMTKALGSVKFSRFRRAMKVLPV
ncbi:Integrase catalytic core protein, partial [Phytophthora palmivora]